ncbi:MAG TPA: hypothetical protein PKY82_08145 [Pyrinomonadaceae bacterium]|nr:hypothetical protein [Pyrinomonadaceae bacterium]
MNNFKHLTQEQIKAYHTDQLSEAESNELGRHLLTCEICRDELPIPSVEQFWSALLTEREIEVVSETKQFEKTNSIFFGLISLWKMPSTLVLGSATLLFLICFSLLLWLSVNNSNEKIVGMTNPEMTPHVELPIPDKTPLIKNPPPANSNRVVSIPTPKPLITDLAKPKSSPNNVIQKTNRKDLNKKEQISETRGASNNCQVDKGLELEFISEKENFVFKWKKFPKAVKYHLYISDDEEILIDEFETETETSFVLKKPLDPLKTYKWKIIVILENGNKAIGESQKFTLKNFQTNQKQIETKRSSDTRCSANG